MLETIRAQLRAFSARVDAGGPMAKATFAGGVFSIMLLAGYLAMSHPPHDAFGYIYGRDFVVFWFVAKAAVAGHIGLVYDFLPQQQALHQLFGIIPAINWGYPPFALLPLLPLGMLPYFPALAVWMALGFGLFLTAAIWKNDRSHLWFIMFAPAVVLAVITGQNGLFTAALTIGALRLIDNRPVLAGFLLGLLACKPQLGLLFPVALALSGRWRSFLSAGCCVAVLAAASWGLFGVPLWQAYFQQGLPFQYGVLAEGSGLLIPMVPTAFMNARFLGVNANLAWAVQTPFSLFALAAVIWTFWRHRDSDLSFGVLITAGFVFTPYAAVYDMVPLAWVIARVWPKLTGKWDVPLMLAVWSLPATAIVFGLCRLPLAAPILTLFLWRLIIAVANDRIQGWMRRPALAAHPAE